MKLATQADRRRDPRFPQSLELILRALPDLGSTEKQTTSSIRGRLQNISERGICLTTPHAMEKSTVLRCEFSVDNVPLKVATLMQVRWSKKQNSLPEGYLSGLEFLL